MSSVHVTRQLRLQALDLERYSFFTSTLERRPLAS